MKKLFTITLLYSVVLCASLKPVQAQGEDKLAVKQLIEQLFDGMRQGNAEQVQTVFAPDADLQTYYIKEGKPMVHKGTVKQFAEAVGQPHEKMWDERIWSYDIRIDGLLATAWTEYSFYMGDEMLHCGVNAFKLFKSEKGWKIAAITDTRRKEKCRTSPLGGAEDRSELNEFIDEWHEAAAEANAEVYFGSIAESGIFLGTDATEHWTKAEFWAYSKPHFDKGKAWAFTPKNRVLYFSEDGQYAWFDEGLDTHMGECRGSGVLKRTGDSWEIEHYNLSMTVPNERIKEYVELMSKKPNSSVKQ